MKWSSTCRELLTSDHDLTQQNANGRAQPNADEDGTALASAEHRRQGKHHKAEDLGGSQIMLSQAGSKGQACEVLHALVNPCQI